MKTDRLGRGTSKLVAVGLGVTHEDRERLGRGTSKLVAVGLGVTKTVRD